MTARVIELRQAAGGEFPQLPHNIEVEQALLGAILINTRDGIPIARMAVRPEHFYEQIHRRVFETMLEFEAQGRTPTPALLGEALSDVEPIGSGPDALSVPAYVARLAVEATTVLNLPDYCRAVRELAVAREGISIGLELAEGLYSRSLDPLPAIGDAVARCDVLMAAGDAGNGTLVGGDDAIWSAIAAMEERRHSGGKPEVSWGFRSLDQRTAGLHRGNFVIAAGRPGMGKTAFLIQIMLRAARAGHGVAFFSLEMSEHEIGARMASTLASEAQTADPVTFFAMRQGTREDRHMERLCDAATLAAGLPMVIDTAPGLTVHDIGARCRRARETLARKGAALDIILVDYLGLVVPARTYRGQKVNEIGEISLALKTLARQTKSVVIAAHQLNREVEKRENKRPSKADLRDSGSLEQDADLIVFPYRHGYYIAAEMDRLGKSADEVERRADLEVKLRECRTRLEVIVDKQRMGPPGSVELYADMATGIIRDVDEQPQLGVGGLGH